MKTKPHNTCPMEGRDRGRASHPMKHHDKLALVRIYSPNSQYLGDPRKIKTGTPQALSQNKNRSPLEEPASPRASKNIYR